MLAVQTLGKPQEREMKTQCLGLSLPISSLFVQAFLLSAQDYFLNPPDPTCNIPSCATLKDLWEAPGLRKTVFCVSSTG